MNLSPDSTQSSPAPFTFSATQFHPGVSRSSGQAAGTTAMVTGDVMPSGPVGSQRETSSAPGNVGTLRLGRRACREGLIFLIHGRPHACMRHTGGETRVPAAGLRGRSFSGEFSLLKLLRWPFLQQPPPSLPGLQCCSPSQTWGRGRGGGCGMSPSLASVYALLGGRGPESKRVSAVPLHSCRGRGRPSAAAHW